MRCALYSKQDFGHSFIRKELVVAVPGDRGGRGGGAGGGREQENNNAGVRWLGGCIIGCTRSPIDRDTMNSWLDLTATW